MGWLTKEKAIDHAQRAVPYGWLPQFYPSYIPPSPFSVAGIPGTVADPHNEILVPLLEAKGKGKAPFVEVSFDDHDDMAGECLSLEAYNQALPQIGGFREYVRRALSIGDFHIAAMEREIVGAVFHVNPRKESIHAYGHIVGGHLLVPPPIIDDGGLLKWADGDLPRFRVMSLQDMIGDLGRYGGLLFTNHDLDGILGSDERHEPEDEIDRRVRHRIEYVGDILHGIPRPDFFAIARSQTPVEYCPEGFVDRVQARLVTAMQRLYR